LNDTTAQWTLLAPRIIFDASAFFSACLSSTGASRRLYRLAESREVILIICDYTVEEVRNNLQRKGYDIALLWLRMIIDSDNFLFVPNPSHEDVKNNINLIPDDPNDIPYLILARDYDADFIVSFDPHLLDLKEYQTKTKSIPILKSGDCLKIITGSSKLN
jgi:predicted nucleic acid-binding protein